MPIIINDLHTELMETTDSDTAPDAGSGGDAGVAASAALEPDLAVQRAAALLAERQCRLEDD